MTKKDAKELLLKYHSGTASDEEKAFAENWMLHAAAGDLDLSDEEIVHDLAEIRQRLGIGQTQKKVTRLWPRIAAAASILLCCGIGLYYYHHQKQKTAAFLSLTKYDVAPGGNKAVLTLANGSRLILTGAKNGKLAVQGSTAINKTVDGEVVYAASEPDSYRVGHPASDIQYNTITTPKTGQYDIVLPDGTKVSLDAESSIRFPVAFTGNERRVEITGQVYFEVAHDKSKPFRVACKGQTVEVLGTHFNINAYDDEPAIKTTLLEGSVKITSENETAVLRPGEQALAGGTAGKINIIQNADTEEAVAWKNGDFLFNGEDIQTIMRKVARWYDIEVVYQGMPEKLRLEGQVSRSKHISAVLAAIELTGKVHFKMDGRRVTVMP